MLIDRAAERSARLMLKLSLKLAARFNQPLFTQGNEDNRIDLRIKEHLPAIHIGEKPRSPTENRYRFFRRRRLRDRTRRCATLQQHYAQQARQDSLPPAPQTIEIAQRKQIPHPTRETFADCVRRT